LLLGSIGSFTLIEGSKDSAHVLFLLWTPVANHQSIDVGNVKVLIPTVFYLLLLALEH
jgi:hypothetical protein